MAARIRRRPPHHRLARILVTARKYHADLSTTLAETAPGDDDALPEVRRILRTYSVQISLAQHSPWTVIYSAIRIGSAVLMVIAPAGLLAPLVATTPRASQVGAVVAYLAFLVALAAGWKFQLGIVQWPRTIAAWCALLLMISVVDIIGPGSWTILNGTSVWLAALGTAVALALVAVRFVTVVWLRDRYFRPLGFRAGAGPLPAHLVTVRLLVLLASLLEVRDSWWHPRERRDLLLWMAGARAETATQLRGSARDLGLGNDLEQQISRRARHLSGFLQQMELRLLDVGTQQDFEAIVTDVDRAFRSISRGDWSPLTLAEEPPVATGRWIALARRAVPAIVLVASALALPHLPGHPPTGDPGIATLQLGLILAAALSLLPIDADVRSRVINAYTSAGKITS
jgi:hypothetical protein